MPVRIEPLHPDHFERLHAVIDAVCRERRFLAFSEGGPADVAMAYYRSLVEAGHPHVVALDGDALLGWCDVLPRIGQMRAHVGVLGMAVAAPARGRGVGRALIDAALDAATRRGLTRVELTVRADNPVAQALYRRVGFVHEGTHRRGWRLDGVDHDVHAMARLADA